MARSQKPYPYGQLPRLDGKQVRAIQALRRRLPALDTATAETTAHRLLGVPTSCEVGLPVFTKAQLPPAFVVLLEGPAPELHPLLRLPRPLAHRLADRVLGGTGNGLPPHTPLSPYGVGALAYVIARILAALQCPYLLRDLYEETAPPAMDALGGYVRLPIRLDLDGRGTWTDLLWPTLDASESPTRGPVTLDQLPLSLTACVGRGTLPTGDVESLSPGDVVVLEHVSVFRSEQSGFQGTANLHLAGACDPIFECAASGAALVLRTPKGSQENTMSHGRRIEQDPREALVAHSPDAPVELSLELARYTLPLSEVATLAPGDVLTTGQPIGSMVTLRAAGKAIAEGELVDVDGEVGLRIVRVKTGRDEIASE